MKTLATACTALSLLAPVALAGDYQLICDYEIGSFQEGYMPDFDQLRDYGELMYDGENYYWDPLGLPSGGNPAGGWNFCFPACGANVIAYLANKGYPDLMPSGAPANWSHESQYNAVSWTIGELGIRMGTNPVSGGTSYDGFEDGLNGWINEHVGANVFDVGHVGTSSNPSLSDMVWHGLAGEFVIVTVGWYEEVSPGYWERNGGHVAVVTGIFNGCSINNGQIRFRDPASDYITEDYLEQSSFTDETYDVEYITAEFASKSGEPFHTRTLGRVLGYGSTYPLGDLKPIIDGFTYVTPLQGIGQGPGGTITVYNPNGVDPNRPGIDDLAIPTPGPIVCYGWDYLSKEVVYADAQEPLLWAINPLTEIARPLSIPAGPQLKQILFDRHGDLYTLETQSICRWDMSTPNPTLVRCESLVFPADVMAIDECTGEVLVLSQAGRMLTAHDLRSEQPVPPEMFQLPEEIELDGQPQMAFASDSCTLWISSDLDRTVHQTKRDVGIEELVIVNELIHLDLLGATSLDVGDDDTIFVVKDGKVQGWRYLSETGVWKTLVGGFVGLVPGQQFHLMRARWHGDDEMGDHILPNIFSNQDPDPCAGDLDGDGQIGVADLLGLLAAWGPAPGHPADLNVDGVIDTQDLLLMLASWGQCA